jgi:hypothetical protein
MYGAGGQVRRAVQRERKPGVGPAQQREAPPLYDLPDCTHKNKMFPPSAGIQYITNKQPPSN